jgi:hypothetical protein
MLWGMCSESIVEAEMLIQPKDFDYLPLIGGGFNQLRRYTLARGADQKSHVSCA